MKGKILSFLIGIMLFMGIDKAYAYTYTITASSSNVTVGSNVTVTLKTNDVMGFYQVTSSNNAILAGSYGDAIESGGYYTKTFTFTAKSAGTAKIIVSPTSSGLNVYSTEAALGSISVPITVSAKYVPQQIYINRTYSDNNNLSKLGIDGYELTPGFNKSTLDYTIELIPGTEKIKVTATAESNVARIRGTGDILVTDGMNTINVKVIAENGNEKTYVIRAHMDEKDPIIVKIDGEEYTVVKKREYIKKIDGYTEGTVKINDFDIPTLHSDITGYTLVGLKDSNGEIKLYLYISESNEYKNYIELSFDKIGLLILEDENSKYEKTSLKIGDSNLNAYKYGNSTEYYLLYGANTTTGNTGYYLYDSVENTVQRFNTDEITNLSKQRDKLIIIVKLLSILFVISLLSLTVIHKIFTKKES